MTSITEAERVFLARRSRYRKQTHARRTRRAQVTSFERACRAERIFSFNLFSES